jgi:transcriptional regulator with XRE-family HTH domain
VSLLRTYIGKTLRDSRVSQGRTLREVASSARVSLGYLSEVERGQKEASSELLGSIAQALDLTLGRIMSQVSEEISRAEAASLVPQLIIVGEEERSTSEKAA